jgi:hypothetical protein
MRAVWGGFALGVIVLQQQAALPVWRGWLVLLLIMSGAVSCAVRGLAGCCLRWFWLCGVAGRTASRCELAERVGGP